MQWLFEHVLGGNSTVETRAAAWSHLRPLLAEGNFCSMFLEKHLVGNVPSASEFSELRALASKDQFDPLLERTCALMWPGGRPPVDITSFLQMETTSVGSRPAAGASAQAPVILRAPSVLITPMSESRAVALRKSMKSASEAPRPAQKRRADEGMPEPERKERIGKILDAVLKKFEPSVDVLRKWKVLRYFIAEESFLESLHDDAVRGRVVKFLETYSDSCVSTREALVAICDDIGWLKCKPLIRRLDYIFVLWKECGPAPPTPVPDSALQTKNPMSPALVEFLGRLPPDCLVATGRPVVAEFIASHKLDDVLRVVDELVDNVQSSPRRSMLLDCFCAQFTARSLSPKRLKRVSVVSPVDLKLINISGTGAFTVTVEMGEAFVVMRVDPVVRVECLVGFLKNWLSMMVLPDRVFRAQLFHNGVRIPADSVDTVAHFVGSFEGRADFQCLAVKQP